MDCVGRTGGRLFVDGSAVDPRWLAGAVGRVAGELTAAGAGPGRGVGAADEPVATVVAALAAQVVGAPIILSTRHCGGGDPRGVAVATVLGDGREVTVRRLPRHACGGALPAGSAAVFGTSGSSGEPKQVALSAAGLEYQAAATAGRLGVDAADGLCVPLPLHHAYGFSILRIWQLTGARLYVETSFRPERIAHLLATGGITSLDGVPSMYASLLGRAAGHPGLLRQLAALRIRGCGGDVLPPSLQRGFLDRVGAPIHDGYGLTEAGPNVAISGPGAWREGAVGSPLPGTEVRLSASGELMVRSPSVMLGYVRDPAATAQAVDADGWLRTGDLATIGPDGYVSPHGRCKDVLVIHGETFAPTEVEAALGGCSGVREACVVAQHTGQVRGDRIVAFVVPDDAGTTAAEVRRELRLRLPAQLRPSDIRLVDALPRLGSGKFDRQELRRRSMALAAS
jgi:acyl-CoA synthetase (AMP-forming)/AMP-acid ligase II